MANLLNMAVIDTIFTLRTRGWSHREIAEALGIHRETVARYLHQAGEAAKPAKAPIGSPEDAEAAKPAKAPIGSPEDADAPKPAKAPIGADTVPAVAESSGRASDSEPWRDVILAKLELGLSAQRIFQDLTSDHGCTASYYSVRRFVARLEAKTELPFRRLECGPGEEVQVDFGTGAPTVGPDGKRRRTRVFRLVLSHDAFQKKEASS